MFAAWNTTEGRRGGPIGLDVSNGLLSMEVAASVASKYVNLSQHVQEVPQFVLREASSVTVGMCTAINNKLHLLDVDKLFLGSVG